MVPVGASMPPWPSVVVISDVVEGARVGARSPGFQLWCCRQLWGDPVRQIPSFVLKNTFIFLLALAVRVYYGDTYKQKREKKTHLQSHHPEETALLPF